MKQLWPMPSFITSIQVRLFISYSYPIQRSGMREPCWGIVFAILYTQVGSLSELFAGLNDRQMILSERAIRLRARSIH